FPDAEANRPAIRSVSRREELYSGRFVGNSPDLLVNFYPGFRVSWRTAVGRFANSLLEDNKRRSSGDHSVDPESVPAILFMIRKARHKHAQIIDLEHTILNYIGDPISHFLQ